MIVCSRVRCDHSVGGWGNGGGAHTAAAGRSSGPKARHNVGRRGGWEAVGMQWDCGGWAVGGEALAQALTG